MPFGFLRAFFVSRLQHAARHHLPQHSAQEQKNVLIQTLALIFKCPSHAFETFHFWPGHSSRTISSR
ncbi:protein of unknown function [Burkholderia multivorans]